MQLVVLLILLIFTISTMRRTARLTQAGLLQAANRRYRRAAWTLGLTIWLAMGVQEAALLVSGKLGWHTGLPLHLCSLMGVLSLPMLLTRRPLLMNAALYAGVPGAVLALLFPAVLDTCWPLATTLAFHTLHAGLVCAPLLPMGMGWRPAARGALHAGIVVLAAGLAALAVNPLTGGNYLFLAGPVAGTPLTWLARGSIHLYRLRLTGLAALVLALEAAAVRGANRIGQKRP